MLLYFSGAKYSFAVWAAIAVTMNSATKANEIFFILDSLM
jgi:hypothetical protein